MTSEHVWVRFRFEKFASWEKEIGEIRENDEDEHDQDLIAMEFDMSRHVSTWFFLWGVLSVHLWRLSSGVIWYGLV